MTVLVKSSESHSEVQSCKMFSARLESVLSDLTCSASKTANMQLSMKHLQGLDLKTTVNGTVFTLNYVRSFASNSIFIKKNKQTKKKTLLKFPRRAVLALLTF